MGSGVGREEGQAYCEQLRIVPNLLLPPVLESAAGDDCWSSLEVVLGDLQHFLPLLLLQVAELDQTYADRSNTEVGHGHNNMYQFPPKNRCTCS